MIFKGKCFFCYILLSDQISLSLCSPLPLEILGNMCIAIVCFSGCDVIHFKINFSFLMKSFFYMIKKLRQKFQCDCNGIRTHNHLVCKRTLNHLARLVKWLNCVISTYLYGTFEGMVLLCLIISLTIKCRFTLKRDIG